MNKILFVTALILLTQTTVSAQASGNINYLGQTRFPETSMNLNSHSKDVIITVKGLANVKADSYVAIFNITQVGEDIEELTALADKRIDSIKTRFKGKTDMEFFTDMVSFVPVYEYEAEKKLFSKKTYNEIPKGFELKMNLHVKYKDPEVLGKIVSACAKSEVYDLIRVDYFSEQLEQLKKELAAKSKVLLKEKLKLYQEMFGSDLTDRPKQMADGYRVMYPLEMYRSYQAYASSSLNLKKEAGVVQADKSNTLYYQPVVNKEFDFVINGEIVEPVIQVMYEITFVVVMPDPVVEKPKKEYLLVTPAGEVKTLSW